MKTFLFVSFPRELFWFNAIFSCSIFTHIQKIKLYVYIPHCTYLLISLLLNLPSNFSVLNRVKQNGMGVEGQHLQQKTYFHIQPLI
jgi:hypothetical protein